MTEEPSKDSLQQHYQELNTAELMRIHLEGSLTDMAYSILENELASRGEAIPPRPRNDEPFVKYHPVLNPSVHFLKQHLKGKRSLASAFWRVGVGGTILLFIFLIGVSILGNLLQTITGPVNVAAFLTLCIGLIATWLFVSWASIWRCSNNAKNVAWKYLARIAATIFVIQYLYAATIYMFSLFS